MTRPIVCLILLLSVGVICQSGNLGKDPNSFSNPDFVFTESLYLNWNLDLFAQTLNGSSQFSFKVLQNNVRTVYLDIWNELNITQNGCLYRGQGDASDVKVTCTVNLTQDSTEDHGNQLIVTLPKALSKDSIFNLTVSYFINNHEDPEGQDGSEAIMFLKDSLTPSKKLPAAFSHSQMIYARSLSPLQDTPSVKFTWRADVNITPNVDTTGFYMPGDSCGVTQMDDSIDYISFCYTQQDIRTPSYQIAFIAGELRSLQVEGTLSHIITFPEWMDQGYEYLQNSLQYLKAVEKYLDLKYPYKRVNIVIPPASFPYSSMENGNLIFISRSVIPAENNMGDELGHFVLTKALAKAWFGTLVNIANWESVWLTEGISTFVARQAIKSLFDFNYNLNNLVANQSLYSFVNEIYKKEGPTSTNVYLTLTPRTTNRDPYRALNTLVREKGNQFLEYLQNFVLTPDDLRIFLKQWITKHSNFTTDYGNNSVTNDDFHDDYVQYLSQCCAPTEYFFNKSDINHWLEGYGMPKPQYQNLLLSYWNSKDVQQILQLAEQFLDMRGIGAPKKLLEVASYWSPNHILLFLSHFQIHIDEINRSKLGYRLFKTMDKIFGLQQHRAIEVRAAFVELALRSEYIHNVLTPLEQILVGTGNLEIILPLYQTLVDIGYKSVAQSIYAAGKKYYHPMAVSRISAVLKSN